MEEERNIITFFCFNGANGHGVGKSEMVYSPVDNNYTVLVRTCDRRATSPTESRNSDFDA